MDLHFRRITAQDLEMIMAWRTMPEISRYMYTDFTADIKAQQVWYDSIRSDPTRLDWLIVVDGEGVGLVSIVRISALHSRCEWAYYLASPDVRGRGIGRSVEMNVLNHVFASLGMHKLCCEVFVSNDIVIKIHEKYGSVIEGTRREHIHKDGKYHDIVEMAILRRDWEDQIRGALEYVPARIDPLGKEVTLVGAEL